MDGDTLTDLTIFKPLDLKRYAQRLELEKRGTERGSQERPAADSVTLDDIENEVLASVAAERTQVRGDVVERMRAINELITKARSKLTTTDLESRVAPKVAAIEQRAAVDLKDLQHDFERLTESRADFADWRQRRRLRRPARSPKSAINFFADLFLIAIIEGVMNLFFFTENNAFGIVGAFFQAFLIAGANILLCTVIGFALVKRLNSIFIVNKLIGLVSITVLLVGLPLVHLVLGFYRIARTTLADAGSSPLWTAVSWAQAREFHRLDELSFLMIAVGIIAGAYATRKGYEFGDRYPDYTKRYKDSETHRNEFLDHLDDATKEMLDEQAEASQAVAAFLYELGPSLQALDGLTDRKRELAASLRNYESHLDDAVNTLLSTYRETNRNVRKTAAPKHFDVRVALPDPFFVSEGVRDAQFAQLLATGVDVRQAREAADRARTMAQAQQARIETAIAATRKQLDQAEVVRDVAT